jgi:2-(3-amino-3-carboxypropyl)histidine synthase
MEDDRALVDLGAAADIEEARLEVHTTESETTKNETPATTTTTRQPKRRFVGRRAADEAAAAKATTEQGGSGAVQGTFRYSVYLMSTS